MSRFSKTGLVVLAVVGVLSFFGPFDNGQVLGAPPDRVPVRESFDLLLIGSQFAFIDVDFHNPAVIEAISVKCDSASDIYLITYAQSTVVRTNGSTQAEIRPGIQYMKPFSGVLSVPRLDLDFPAGTHATFQASGTGSVVCDLTVIIRYTP